MQGKRRQGSQNTHHTWQGYLHFLTLTTSVILAPGCHRSGDQASSPPADGDLSDLRTGIAPGAGLNASQITGSTCKALKAADADQGSGISITKIFPALANAVPVALAQPPGKPEKWLMADLLGKLTLFPNQDNADESKRVLALDLTASLYAENEAGLLGFAYAPDYATSRRAYLTFTTGAEGSLKLNLARLKARTDDTFISPPEVILSVDAPNNFHLGGNVAFGPDGMLYIALGFGGTGDDAERRAQDLTDLHGKFLRLDVSGNSGYQVPNDNPFVGVNGARREIFARGFRNPWRWSFDRATGTLWAGDVGKDTREEIDIVRAGRNYGWPVREGDQCNVTAGQSPCQVPDQEEPVWAYGRDQGSCVTGGFVYRGKKIGALAGAYIFTDCLSGSIFALRLTEGQGCVA